MHSDPYAVFNGSARELVEKLWKGETVECDGGSYSLTKVAEAGKRKPKYLIARADVAHHYRFPAYWGVTPNSKFYLVYPRPEHAERFVVKQASPNAMIHGVIVIFGGAIGAVHALPSGTGEKMEFAQGINVDAAPQLDRGLYSKHGGWREHLFDYYLRRLKTTGHDYATLATERTGADTPSIFEAKALEHGFTKITRTPGHIEVRLPVKL